MRFFTSVFGAILLSCAPSIDINAPDRGQLIGDLQETTENKLLTKRQNDGETGGISVDAQVRGYPRKIGYSPVVFSQSFSLDGSFKPRRIDALARDFYIESSDKHNGYSLYAYIIMRDRPSLNDISKSVEILKSFFCETENIIDVVSRDIPNERSALLLVPTKKSANLERITKERDPVDFLSNHYDFVLSRLWWNAAERSGFLRKANFPSELLIVSDEKLFEKVGSVQEFRLSNDLDPIIVNLDAETSKVRERVSAFRQSLVLPEEVNEKGNWVVRVRLLLKRLADTARILASDPASTTSLSIEDSNICYI